MAAAAALDIIILSGSREIRANDLGLRLLQSGFGARAMSDALKAFERRGWLVRWDSVIEISAEGFCARPVVAKKTPPSRKRHTRLPSGLFPG